MLVKKELYPKLLVFLQFTLMGAIIFFSKGFFSSLTSLIISSFGIVLGVWALLHNKIGNFNIQPKMKEDALLVTTGIYAYIRHPMYFSVILINFAFVLSTVNLLQSLLFLTLVIVLYLKAKREESLWLTNNQEYNQYKNNTKFFVPFVL